MDQNALYYLIATALIVIGLVGTVLPALPGLPLVFAGMLLAAWAGDFQQVGIPMLVVLGLLTVLSLGIDLGATALGAKRVGASRKASGCPHHRESRLPRAGRRRLVCLVKNPTNAGSVFSAFPHRVAT